MFRTFPDNGNQQSDHQMIMTKQEAERAAHLELSTRELKKKMSSSELLLFCQEMYGRLEFQSKGDRMQDIRRWAEDWEQMWIH